MTADPGTVLRTGRWRGITSLAFGALGAGIVFGRPPLVVASVVGIAFAAYARSGTPPAPALTVERALTDADPPAGETVGVTTTLTNDGGMVFDLRVFDGVPAGLEVSDGPARTATALGPGETASLSYDVTATRGEHVWGDLTVLARDASGATEVETAVQSPPTTLTATPRLTAVEPFSLRPLTTPHTGRVASLEGGPGVEFHSLRSYRHGDPLGSVAWRHLARTGELVTEVYHAERMASVLLLFDVRAAAYAGTATGGAPTAVEFAVGAGRQLAGTLLDDGNQVGVAGLGPENCYLEPGLGRTHRARLERFLATDPVLSPTAPEGPFYPTQLDELRRRLRDEVQVLWLSPLLDDYAVEVARTLESRRHAVTVVSPDVTERDTPGRLLASAERRHRLTALREAGIRVVDWRPPEPFAAATARATRGWQG